jgi:hypothetical protein
MGRIKLIIEVGGSSYEFEEPLPSVISASHGPMSMHSALEPVTSHMIFNAVYQMLRDAVITVDNELPHPRHVWSESS